MSNVLFKYCQLKHSSFYIVESDGYGVGEVCHFNAGWKFSCNGETELSGTELRAIADKLDELNTQSQTANE